MGYPTIDYIPDLIIGLRSSAKPLELKPMSANAVGWDGVASVSRSDSMAEYDDIYRITMTEGATYTIISASYFGSGPMRIYDADGNCVAATGGSSFGAFVAPYTGTFYIEAAWDQGSYFTSVSLTVYEDFPAGSARSINDNLSGSRVAAGPGNDSITGTAGQDYLRGEDGDDVIVGGAAFDDLHGNAGNDTVSGGDGDDWVVGGKDNDQLKGEWGDDIVYGNLGDDTCEGGGGDDIVRGGQGNDLLLGGDGRDWISGDRGNDTITGGAGADTFNTFADAGLDRVTDFNRAEGDVVRVEGGVYTWAQVGGDVEITIAGSAKLTLIGVQASSLTDGWIVSA